MYKLKKAFFLVCRNRSDSIHIKYYKKDSRILADLINLAKNLYYNKLLVNSTNKTKTTLNIINNNINRNTSSNAISSIKVNVTVSTCNQTIADTFNKYFVTVAQDILAANTKNGNAAFINNNPLN